MMSTVGVQSWRMVVAVLWLLAAAAVVTMYRLGYLRGEIAAMTESEATRSEAGRACRPATAEIAKTTKLSLNHDCGGRRGDRPTDATTDVNDWEVAR